MGVEVKNNGQWVFREEGDGEGGTDTLLKRLRAWSHKCECGKLIWFGGSDMIDLSEKEWKVRGDGLRTFGTLAMKN